MNTMVELSAVVANATCNVLPLNVALVVLSEALLVPCGALVRVPCGVPVPVPAVAHTRPAGALQQRCGPR